MLRKQFTDLRFRCARREIANVYCLHLVYTPFEISILLFSTELSTVAIQ